MRKYGNLRTFSHLAKRAYQHSKKNNLGWTWNEAQRFTSANLYQDFKGQPKSKIRVTDIDRKFDEVLDIAPKVSKHRQAPEICYNPFYIPSSELEDINWWQIVEEVEKFDSNLKIAIELDGFLNTGIVKKSTLPNLVPVREDMRKANLGYLLIIFKILVVPGREDDNQPCSYYVLVTFEGSMQDSSTQENEKVAFVSEESLPEDVRERRDLEKAKRESDQSSRASKKAVKERKRPTKVQLTQAEEKEQQQSQKYIQLNSMLDKLRKDFDDGLITKKQYQDRQKKILDNLEKGGEI